MLKKIFFATLAVLVFFNFNLLSRAEATGGWSAPVNLGAGYGPEFTSDIKHNFKLTFERDDKLFQSFYQNNGKWSKPEASGKLNLDKPVTAFNKDGKLHEVIGKADGIYYSQENSVPVKITSNAKDYSSYPLYLYIDEKEVKHMIYVYGKSKDAPNLMYKRQVKNGNWEKNYTVANKINLFRTWQYPGITITPSGNIYICTYNDLFSKIDNGPWKKEKCKFDNIYMPVKVVADNNENLHFLYYSWKENRDASLNALYYVCCKSGKWSQPVKVGDQHSERIPCLMITGTNELLAAWEDKDGNIRVSRKFID